MQPNQQQTATESQVDQLIKKGEEFWGLFTKLQNDAYLVQGTALEAEYNKLMKNGSSVRSRIDSIKTAIESGANFLAEKAREMTDQATDTYQGAQDTASMHIGDVMDWLKNQAGMGILPAMPVLYAVSGATITAAISSMGKWITEARAFDKKMDFFKEMVNEGKMTADQAAKAVNTQMAKKDGFLMNLFPSGKQMRNLVIAGAVGWVAWEFWLKPKRR